MSWENPFPSYRNSAQAKEQPTNAIRIIVNNDDGSIRAWYLVHPDNVSRIAVPTGCTMAVAVSLPAKDEPFMNLSTGRFRKTAMPKKAKK